jgi:hypothetical protein
MQVATRISEPKSRMKPAGGEPLVVIACGGDRLVIRREIPIWRLRCLDFAGPSVALGGDVRPLNPSRA